MLKCLFVYFFWFCLRLLYRVGFSSFLCWLKSTQFYYQVRISFGVLSTLKIQQIIGCVCLQEEAKEESDEDMGFSLFD